MDYPKTDDDWVKLAEWIVHNNPEVLPEHIGALTVDATATIFTWYSSDERASKIRTRQFAREELLSYARQYGGLPEREELRMGERMVEVPLGREEQHYWEVTNMVTGEVLQEGVPYRTITEASIDAKRTMNTLYPYFEDNHLVIKIFDKSPDERAGLTFEPERTESYWREGPAKSAQDVLDRISQPLDRPFPQVYGDWVNLGESIKEKAGIDNFATTAEVNEHLYHIYKEEEDPETAQVSKMWLTRKAQELGVK